MNFAILVPDARDPAQGGKVMNQKEWFVPFTVGIALASA
jgi:hypothetical protein